MLLLNAVPTTVADPNQPLDRGSLPAMEVTIAIRNLLATVLLIVGLALPFLAGIVAFLMACKSRGGTNQKPVSFSWSILLGIVIGLVLMILCWVLAALLAVIVLPGIP